MTTPVYKSGDANSQTGAQSAMQKPTEVASETRQRFEQLLGKKPQPHAQATAAIGRTAASNPLHRLSLSDSHNVEKRPRSRGEEDDTVSGPPPAWPTSANGIAQAETGRANPVRRLSSVSATDGASAHLKMALDALLEAASAPAPLSAANADGWMSGSIELRVDVLSGPLRGAQMRVAAQQGKLRMTVRAAGNGQRAALESIRNTLVSKVRSLDQFEIELEPERHSNA